MKKLKNNLVLIIFSVTILSYAIYKNIEFVNLRYTGEKTEGEVVKGLRYITWSYFVDGKYYRVNYSKSEASYVVDGEKYIVYYDPKNPSNSLMSFQDPIIDPAIFDTVASLPLTLELKSRNPWIDFSYFYKGKIYDRTHSLHLKENFKSNNECFSVYVNSEDPRISYIDLKAKTPCTATRDVQEL
jgi:hypothetical protein